MTGQPLELRKHPCHNFLPKGGRVGSVLQIAGAVLVTVGVMLLSVPVGLIIGGVFVLVAGLAVSN